MFFLILSLSLLFGSVLVLETSSNINVHVSERYHPGISETGASTVTPSLVWPDDFHDVNYDGLTVNTGLSPTKLPIPSPSTELVWSYNGSSQLNSLGDVDGDGQIEMVMSNVSLAGGRQVISIWKYDLMNQAWNMWAYDEITADGLVAWSLDLDHDGTAELLLNKRLTSSSYSNVVVLAHWTETGLVELTNEFTINGALYGGPDAYDFDGDGVDEISLCSGYTSGSSAWILDWTGSSLIEMWRRNFGTTWMADTKIANVDDEPGMELVIIEGRDGRFEIYDWTGTTFIPLLQTTIDLGWIYTGLRALFVDDFNQNGINEVVVGTGWHHVGDENIDAYLIVYEWTGTEFEQTYWSPDYRRQLYYGIQADLTGDGISEIILNYGEDIDRPGADPHVSIRKWNGTAFDEIWRWSVERPVLCAVADVDNDGRLEFFATDRPYHEPVFWQWTGMFEFTHFPHSPIVIDGDEDFVNQAWPGSGTLLDPYRIKNFFIDLESASGSCIAIYNTRAYFLIENCFLTGASAGNEYDYNAGIFLSNVTNGQLINNICTENNYGILTEYSNENVLTNNTLATNRWLGILATYSDFNTINNNTVTDHHYQGLVLDHSNDNICDNNSCYENGHGMFLSVSHNNTIINSNFTLNDWGGLSLHFSRDNTVNTCNFVGCGFLLGWSIYDWELQQRQISDNYVNGKPLIYRQNQIGGSITGPAGQIVLLNCSNLIIADYIIENCTIGIHLVHCDNCTIENNISTNQSIAGIDISYSDHNTLRNNTCNYEAGYGGVNGGVLLFGQCHYNLITNNTCQGNEKGIRIHDSTRNQIIDNTFADNYYGIDLDPSSGCNCIQLNRFIDNTVNALDDGFCNNVDYNYWSDYTGVDENLDGIGDTPYYFTGTAENFDPHPLMYSFGIIAWQPTLLTLSGNFDYLEKEDIRLQIASLLTNRETGSPISGAIVTATIYDPDGAELLTVDLIEEVPGSGVYIYRSPFTIKDLKWPKGIYLVYAEATIIDHNIIIGEAVDMLQFHIDPPGEIDTNPLAIPVWLLATTIGLVIINIGLLPLYWRRRKHTRPL
jgi:parallel beta-helix repeat protein